jgi:penicillin-binding protein 1B
LSQVERRSGELQGAIVLVEPASGEIRALVGDRNPGRFGFNRAVDARRQVGSVIKPFVYLLALAQPEKYTLVSRLSDAELSVPVAGSPPWQPRNLDDTSHGDVALMQALAMSYNQATVALGLEIGLPALFRLLRQLGVEPGGSPHPSALLGAIDMTPLQVAQLYQPLAAEGYSTPLRTITEVVDANGQAIGRYPVRMRPIRDREAWPCSTSPCATQSPTAPRAACPGALTTDPGIRGKTGTTNDRRDAWFVGYTRDWLGVVWTGRDDNAPAAITGASTALPVWAELFAALPVKAYDRSWPENIDWYWIDWPTPLLASEDCRPPGPCHSPGSQPTRLSPCMTRQTSRLAPGCAKTLTMIVNEYV